MYGLKHWKILNQAKQGICIFNGRLEIIYANKKARNVLRTLDPELYKQFKSACWRFMAIVRAKKASLLNYGGKLTRRRTVINFSCFSLTIEGQEFIMAAFDYEAGDEPDLSNEVVFTPREKDIFQAVADGKTNKEISEVLGIRFETVKSHIRNLLAKTGAASRTELIGKYGQQLL